MDGRKGASVSNVAEEVILNKYIKINRSYFIFLGIILLILFILFFLTACEPGGYITIQNQRSEEVSIYFTHVRTDGSLGRPSRQGIIPPNTAKKFGIVFLGNEWIERIEAKDSLGSVVFSYDYNMDDLEKIDWKIVIPP